MTTKHVGQIAQSVLTATQAPPTKAAPISLKALESWATFQTFNDPQLKLLLAQAGCFVQAMKNGDNPRWLSMLGHSDQGKTYLAKRIWKWFQDFGKNYTDVRTGATLVRRGQFLYWPSLLEELRSGAYGRMDDLKTDALVVLDDIGAERDPTGFSADKLNTLLNLRLNKWTIITCNLPLRDIAVKVDYRVASRMMRDGNIVVDSDTTDFSLRPSTPTPSRLETH